MSDHYRKMVSAMFEQKRQRMAPTQTIIDRLDAKKAMEDKIKKMFSPKPAASNSETKKDSN